MVGDSQVKKLENAATEVQAKQFIFIGKGGLRAEGLRTLLWEKVFSDSSMKGKFSQIALWVGGNDADETHRRSVTKFQPEAVGDCLAEAVIMASKMTGLPVVLLSASPRKGEKGRHIKKLNMVINSIAEDLVYSNVHICNVHRKLSRKVVMGEDNKRKPTVDWALEADGVHISQDAAGIVLDHIMEITLSFDWGGHRSGGQTWAKHAAGREVILVHGPESLFSNFFPAQLVLCGRTYNCGEQAYQHIKALNSEDWLAAEQIMCLVNPFAIKSAGAKIRATEKTNSIDYKRTLALLIMGTRVAQQVDFREGLIKSGTLNFIHSVRDKV